MFHHACYLVGIHAAGAGIEDFLVAPTLAVDVLRRSTLYHATLLQHVDLVGIDYLADVVGDDDDGSAALDGVEARLNLLGGNGVEAGRRW